MHPHRLSWLLALAALAAAPTAAPTAAHAAAEVTPLRESAPLFEDEGNDADDPAIWVNPLLRDRSVIVATKKDAGLTAFDLGGRTLQDIAAPPAPAGDDHAAGRFNNVDVVYGARIGRVTRDLAIVSDRGSDKIRTYAINPLAASLRRAPLTDIRAPSLPFVFNTTQEEVDEQATAYGLTAWVDQRTGTPYVVTSRRSRSRVALLKLVAAPGGKVTYQTVDTIDAPTSFTLPSGGTWAPCVEEEGEEPQFEGMTVDADRGTLFAGQEDVGIWRISVSPRGFGEDGTLVEKVKEFGAPYTLVPDDDPGEFECETTGDALPGDGGEHIAPP
ncbi:MAG: phytase, partial [Baekduiaceae bacterium]